MGLLDDAVGALDALAKSGAPGAAVSKPAEFKRDEPLSTADNNKGGAAGPTPDGSGKPVPFDLGIPTEFIHYGLVHADMGKLFPHNPFPSKSNGNGQPPPVPDGHAMMFRDALEREAILLFGFVSSTKVVLKENLEAKGPLEDIGAAVGSMLGGGPSTPKPDPSQLDTFASEIKAEADKIKPTAIKYPDIHAAGKKLHEIRSNYIGFCESLEKHYLKPPEEGGPAGALSSMVGSIPGIGNTMQVIQRWLFKLPDIYMAIYLEIRKNHERNIELASHKMTIDAIKDKYQTFAPIYPVWFKKPEVVQGDSGGGDDGNLLKPVTEKIDEVKKDVEEKVDEVKKTIYDFAGANDAPEQTPGTGQMTAIFSAMSGVNKDSANPGPPTVADATISALNATLTDIGGLPKFIEVPVKEVTAANVGMLEDVYKRLMAAEAAGTIEPADLLEAGRRYLTGMISGIATKLVVGLLPSSVGGGGDDFNVQGLSVKQMLGHHLDELLGKYTEPILKIAIGDLAGQLEESRKKASQEKAQTMEVFLGRLPWLTALMFRNTFFPIWNILIKDVFGKALGPLAGPLDSATSALDKARDKVDEGQEYKRRAEKLNEVKNEGVNVGSGGSNLDKYKDAVEDETEEGKKRRAEREAEMQKNQAMKDFFKPNGKDDNFPVTGRILEGSGEKVQDEIPSVLPEPGQPAQPSQPAQPIQPAPPSPPAIPAGL
jgi:hypothetical protein